MNDDELDRLVAGLAPMRDKRVVRLDLRDAEDDLLEDIMATTTTRVSLRGHPAPDGPQRRRHRLRTAFAVGTIAAGVLAVAAIVLRDDAGDVVTKTPDDPSPTTTEVGRPSAPIGTDPLVALPIPEGYVLGAAEEQPTEVGDTEYWVSYDVATPVVDRNFQGFTVRTVVDLDGTWWENLSSGRPADLEVRGHPAVGEGAAGTHYISWQEKDGVVVTVSFASDAPEGAFEDFVPALRPADLAEWQTILETAPEPAPG